MYFPGRSYLGRMVPTTRRCFRPNHVALPVQSRRQVEVRRRAGRENDHERHGESSIGMSRDACVMPIQTNMNQTSEVVWSIKSVDRTGRAEIALKFGRQKMTME